jgi:hypothetical protein
MGTFAPSPSISFTINLSSFHENGCFNIFRTRYTQRGENTANCVDSVVCFYCTSEQLTAVSTTINLWFYMTLLLPCHEATSRCSRRPTMCVVSVVCFYLTLLLPCHEATCRCSQRPTMCVVSVVCFYCTSEQLTADITTINLWFYMILLLPCHEATSRCSHGPTIIEGRGCACHCILCMRLKDVVYTTKSLYLIRIHVGRVFCNV